MLKAWKKQQNSLRSDSEIFLHNADSQALTFSKTPANAPGHILCPALIEYGLKDKEIITEIEAQNIDKEKLLEYTNSQLWTELKQAKEIHKEHPFYINIKASRIYNQINKEDDEDILVQGVIDLFFIDKDDKLILVDYKTDYVQHENELVEKYKGQLDLYKEALEQSLDKKVDKMCIYSVYLNKLIEIGIWYKILEL